MSTTQTEAVRDRRRGKWIPAAEYGDYPPLRSEWLGELEGFMEALERAHACIAAQLPWNLRRAL